MERAYIGLDVHQAKRTCWCERIWTTISTCEAQGRSVFEFLCAALNAHFVGQPSPSLMPPGP